jgi:DNA ligase-1
MKKITLQKEVNGKTRLWSCWTKGDTIYVSYGYQDGAMTEASRKAAPKNVGRANETTAEEQAVLEAKSDIKVKLDEGYYDPKDGKQNTFIKLPMLAHDYFKKQKYLSDDFFIQPKLDGVRCIAYRNKHDVVLYSRTGKIFEAEFLDLRRVLTETMHPGDYFDGELYSESYTFEEIVGAVRRGPDSGTEAIILDSDIDYHVYDMIADGPFEKRFEELENRLEFVYEDFLQLVETNKFDPENDDLDTIHDRWVSAGYEGIILRNAKGLYQVDKRSTDLLKFKKFLDEEFEIIGAKEGVGKEVGAVTWVCKTSDGKEFEARPRGSYEERKAMWKNRNKYIGKLLTVRYQNLTADDIPRFPVGLTVRDYE